MKQTSTFLLLVFLSLYACSKKDIKQDETLTAISLSNVAYGNDPAQVMDIYLPAGRNADSTKVIVLVHGGAWVEGDKKDFETYLPVIKQKLKEYAIVNINYRLASSSGNYFPTQENDMKAVLDFIIQKRKEYNISGKFVLFGASAGAHMAMLQGYKYSTPGVKAIIDFFGPVDMVRLYNQAPTTIAQYGIQMLLSGTPTTNPSLYQQSSPINFIDAQDPPTIIFHGTSDMIVDVSHSTLLQIELQSHGVVNSLHLYTGLGHTLWPEAIMDDAFDKMESFIRANVP
jgi:acetyl esterase/lipase